MVNLTIEINSRIPIHRQIYDQIKSFVSTGELKSGERIPSSRTMAGTLEVNYHTVNQAYQMLWKDGIINLEKGKKYVVAETRLGKNMCTDFEKREKEIIKEAIENGMSENEVLQVVQTILDRRNEGVKQ